MTTFAIIIMTAWGFCIGVYFAEWRASFRPDLGVAFIAAMVTKMRKNTKFVQPNVEVTVSHDLKIEDESYVLSLCRKGQQHD